MWQSAGRACNWFSVVVNYNTNRTGTFYREDIAMRSSDRIWAAALAVIVWLFAGYAIASRATAPQAMRSCALGARAVGSAAVGLAIGRP
jgi:hypothetical protein